MPKKMLWTKHISYTVKHRTILNDINLNINENDIYAICGKNGSGKSTLLRLMAGTLKTQQGNIGIDKNSLKQIPNHILAKKRALLPQNCRVYFPFLAKEVIKLGRINFKDSKQHSNHIADKIMNILDITSLANKYFSTLSGGEQQLVLLGCVMAQLEVYTISPYKRYLLLDEPTSNLDIDRQHHILKLLKTYCQQYGICVIIILHDLNLISRYAHQCILLKDGKLLSQDHFMKLYSNGLLNNAFNTDFELLASNTDINYVVSS